MKMTGIIIIVLISMFIWCISIYNGWIKEAFIFGYGILNSWIEPKITWDDNTTTIKYGKYAYRLLNEISIPENITAIESNAFKGNKLTNITIGSNVNLGDNSFGYNFENFYSIFGMKAGKYTRDYYENEDWTVWIDDYGYKSNVDSVTIIGYTGSDTEVVIPSEFSDRKITNIAKDAYRGKNLTKITIPASVTFIGDSAFRENNLTNVTIPDSVYRIDNYAFYKNQLTNFTIGKTTGVIGRYAFADNKLTRIFLPNNVKSIEVYAFKDNQITRVSIGENVTLGSDSSVNGILGDNTGFNSAYSNNKNRAGVYTRPNVKSSSWTRVPR
jgi:hypothetical protein